MNLIKESTEEMSILEVLKEFIDENIFVHQQVCMERFQQTLPSICIRGEKEVKKGRYTILGEYHGEYLFSIVIRIAPSDEPTVAYRLFEDMNYFLEEQPLAYPVLGHRILCKSIQMYTRPVLEKRNEDGSEDYIATYAVRIKKVKNY